MDSRNKYGCDKVDYSAKCWETLVLPNHKISARRLYRSGLEVTVVVMQADNPDMRLFINPDGCPLCLSLCPQGFFLFVISTGLSHGWQSAVTVSVICVWMTQYRGLQSMRMQCSSGCHWSFTNLWLSLPVLNNHTFVYYCRMLSPIPMAHCDL